MAQGKQQQKLLLRLGGSRLAPPVVYCQGWSVLTRAGHGGQPDERKRLPPHVP